MLAAIVVYSERAWWPATATERSPSRNVALRQQLAALKRTGKRPQLRTRGPTLLGVAGHAVACVAHGLGDGEA
jgi:hypothetical protein